MNPLRCLLLVLLCATSRLWAADALDPEFGQDGYAQIAPSVATEITLGGCPLADGRFVLVALSLTPDTSLISTRLLADGRSDESYGSAGLSEVVFSLPDGLQLVGEHVATACQGVTNSDPGDDRLLIAATWSPTTGNNPDSQTWLAKIDLATGQFEPSFGSGGHVLHNLTSLTPGGRASEFVDGLGPGANGEWLLSGHFLEVYEFEDRTGLVARISGSGAVLTSRALFLSGIHLEQAAGARVGSQGEVQLIGHGRVPAGISWIRLQLAADTLAVQDQSFGSVAGLRLHRGRNVGGGALAVAGRVADAPKAVILRDSGVSVLDLPAIPTLAGRSFSFGGFDLPSAITGGLNGRIVFASGLTGLTAIGERAHYLAMAVLGNGGDVADRIETRFGLQGAATIQRVPPGWSCSGRAPLQDFAGISTWGSSHLLLGTLETACGSSLSRDPLAARLASNFDRTFRNGFE